LKGYCLAEPLMPLGTYGPGTLYLHDYRLADSLHRQELYQNSRFFLFVFSNSEFPMLVDF